MLISRLKKLVILFFCLATIVALILPASSGAAKRKKKDTITETELQAELMAFADRLATYLFQGLRDYEQTGQVPEMRPRIQQDAVLTSMSAFTIAADPNPGTALLDMVALVVMGRLVYATHWEPRYGEPIAPVVAGFAKGEREIKQLALRILDEEEQSVLRDLIFHWHKANPDQVGFAYLRFGYMASEDGTSAADRKKASGLFKSVKEATRQVEETRLMAERTTYLATRIPILFGSLADFWVTDMVKNQEIKQLLEDIHMLSSTVDQLPDLISQERAAVIDHSMKEIKAWSRDTIKQTMRGISKEREQTLKQFFDELRQMRQKTLDDLLTQEQKYSRLLEEMRATLQEGNQLLASANELAKLIPAPDPDNAEAAPAMDIEDYRAALTDARATIRELNNLLAAVEQTANSPALEKVNQLILSGMDQAGRQGEQLIDLSFKRGMLLTLFAVVCLLVAQLIFLNIRKRLSR